MTAVWHEIHSEGRKRKHGIQTSTFMARKPFLGGAGSVGRRDPSPNIISNWQCTKILIAETARRQHHMMWGVWVFLVDGF